MTPDKIAVATVTWARSAGEEALLARSLALLAGTGLPVAVADKGASATFSDVLTHFSGFAITVPAEEGLAAQVEASFALASRFERPFILYVESDKEIFFQHGLDDFLRRAPEDDDVGVVLASRTDESYRTYPPMQRYAEGVINHLCEQVIGPPGDYSYGPFLMNRIMLPSLTPLDRSLGWGWRHYAFHTAHRRRLRVLHIPGEYPCPPNHRDEDDDERRHRLRQLGQNILGLIHA